jgi:NodT family efflux transporter outer membrane factor (OMF) lipoprotein
MLAKSAKPRWSPGLFALAAGLLLSACAPDLGKPPQIQPPSNYADRAAFTAPAADWPADSWWTKYGDPQLNTLESDALAGAPDLKIAEARLRLAGAAAQQAGSALLPALNGDASALSSKQSLNEGFPPAIQSFLPHGWHTQSRATASLDYELDIFGKNRAALAAATSDAKAAEVDVAAARLALSTSVATAYASLVRLKADRDAAQDAVRVRKESAALVADRRKQGLENQGVLDQAEAKASAAEADADIIDGQIAVTRNQIAALLGKGPDRGLEIALPANAHLKPFGLPPTLAADLIGRRPDIVSARLRAEAASQRIKVAHADFYPNIDLKGLIGFDSLDIGSLFKHGSLIGQIGPALHLPIFDGGKIEGNYRGARASYDEAVATYDKMLTGALHDVADSVANERELGNELAHSRASLAASEDAYRIAKLRYQGNLSRYLDVLTAEDTVLAERKRVSELEARTFSEDVALVRALGGGFVTNI